MPDLTPTQGSRRAALKVGLALLGASGVAALRGTAAAAAEKVAPASVSYQTKPKDGKQCSTCAQFVAPNACKVVSGTISPDGWCMIYAAKAA